MNALSFGSAPLLWGLLLAAIPIIIHLLFRRRFRKIEWAPMKYLKLSIQRNRRRFRLEQLLLLALRTLLILLLFFLAARPVMHGRGLAGLLGARSRASHVIVIDDSLSMGHSAAGESALARAQRLANEYLAAQGSMDRASLLVVSRPKLPLASDVEINGPGDLREQLAAIPPTAVYGSWQAALTGIRDAAAAMTYPARDVAVFTDLRRAGWDESLTDSANALSAAGLKLRIFDVGSSEINNSSVAALAPQTRLALAGTPIAWEVEVRNQSTANLEGADVTWIVDGMPDVRKLPSIEPGQIARLSYTTTFRNAGTHQVAIRLEPDALGGDDERFATVRVADRLRVLLVDGEPSTEPLAGELDFAALSLSLGADDVDSLHLDLITDSEWLPGATANYDLIVLGNVGTLTPEQALALRSQIADGAGLLIFVGDQLDPANYNQLLFEKAPAFLPLPLETPVDEEISGLVLEDASDSPLDALAALTPAVRERIRVRRYFQTGAPAGEEKLVRILARWNNAAGAPAVIERSFGSGKVLLWTVTADKQWSDWPTEPSYVLAVREAAMAIARTSLAAPSLTAGQPLRWPLAPGIKVTEATAEVPHVTQPVALTVEASDDADAGTPNATGEAAQAESTTVLALDDTRSAGMYKLAWQTQPSAPGAAQIAVSPDVRESDLARASEQELLERLRGVDVQVIPAAAESGQSLAVGVQEIWRSLATCLLALVGLEAALATWVGRQR